MAARSNENTNGLLRQYFPKRTAILLSQSELAEVAAQLNARPRKTLGFMTPAEKLAELTGVTRGPARLASISPPGLLSPAA